MLTLLQLSDIHFRKKPEELDEYSQMRVRMLETLEDCCKIEPVNAIIVCGDIAFSGKHEEYEEKAKMFINELQAKTGCSNEQVYMVPGNHDKNRDTQGNNTRALMREGLLYGNSGSQLLSQICQEEPTTLCRLIEPFEEYIKYASRHRCVSSAVLKIYLGEKATVNDKLYWHGEIGTIGDYRVVLYGINSCLVSDWEDRDNPKDENKGHLQYLSKQMYNISRHRDEISISMMHHPLDFIKGGDDIESTMDGKFAIQFYGHIHKPSVQKDDALKIFSGALQPPFKEMESSSDYYPVFNIIQLDIVDGILQVHIQPFVWRWVDDEDGYFERNEMRSYQLKIKNDASRQFPKRKHLKLPENQTARALEIDFMTRSNGENIIKKMYPDFVLKHEPIADFEVFFARLRNDDRYVELYDHLKR